MPLPANRIDVDRPTADQVSGNHRAGVFFPLPAFFLRPQTCGFFGILYPEEVCPVAGLGVRKNNKIPVEANGNRGNADDMDVKDLEPRFDIDRLGKIAPDIIPALLERCITDQDLVIKRFYAAHGATSSIAFFSGRGLCTAFAAIFVQGKVICCTRSSWCSPYTRTYSFAFDIAPIVAA